MKTRKPIDVLESRYKHNLCEYFDKFSYAERSKVKYVIMDLWASYKNIAKTYFPSAKIIADRFHYSRYIVQAVDKIRK